MIVSAMFTPLKMYLSIAKQINKYQTSFEMDLCSQDLEKNTTTINKITLEVLTLKKSQLKGKITKILNPKENSKRKVPNQTAKSKIQTHQTNR